MRRLFLLCCRTGFLFLFLLCCACDNASVHPPASESLSHFPMTELPKSSTDFSTLFDKRDTPTSLRGVWISYLELNRILKKHTKEEFTESFEEMLEQMQSQGLNTVFVQVRSHGDAYYPSEHYPWSYYVTGNPAESCDFDPLQIMLDLTKEYQIELHAWINPYRLMTDTQMKKVSKKYRIRQWYQKEDYMKQKEDGYWYLDPGNEKVTALIVKGVEELVEQYPIAGIHLDDYFYHMPPKSFGDTVKEAKQNTTTMVQCIYQTVKKINPDVEVGISPAGAFGEIPNSDRTQYTDLITWCSKEGYMDYVMPQIYWDFDDPEAPFEKTLQKWENLVKDSPVTLYVGLASYKFAGTETIPKQIKRIEDSSVAKGFSLFRYDHILS